MNTYSNENHTLDFIKTEQNNIPFFLKVREVDFTAIIVNPYYFIKNKKIQPSQEIYGKGQLNEFHLSKYLTKHNPQISYSDALILASNYIKCSKLEGINHDIAFAQMCLETGFLKFGGSVSPEQNNFCGLGAINEKCAGESFKTPEIGITAHVQHLKAYASTDKLNSPLVDTRFKYVKRGSVKTINDLTGKWATDPDYGKKIVRLLEGLYSI